MTIPKKDSRQIKVNKDSYRWYLRDNALGSEWKHIAIQHATISGQVLLLDPFSWWLEIRPKTIRAAILFALKHGWTPKTSGKPLYIGYDKEIFLVLPSDKEYLLK